MIIIILAPETYYAYFQTWCIKSKKRFPNDGLIKMQTYRILQDICGFTGTNVCFRCLPCFKFNQFS